MIVSFSSTLLFEPFFSLIDIQQDQDASRNTNISCSAMVVKIFLHKSKLKQLNNCPQNCPVSCFIKISSSVFSYYIQTDSQ